jgi:hypothetical protein
MAAKKTKKRSPSHTLTLKNVKELAASLIDVADRYPKIFVTEVDFYPLVIAFLSWKLKGLRAEAPLEGGQAVDFKVQGTTNPAYLELAVAPRALGDMEAVLDAVRLGFTTFAREEGPLDEDDAGELVQSIERKLRSVKGPLKLPDKTQLYASVNESELKKLSTLGGATKGRFLLLLDLRRDGHDVASLTKNYMATAKKLPGSEGIRVVYAHRAAAPSFENFLVRKPAKKKGATKKKGKKAMGITKLKAGGTTKP